jgi:dihydroorotate dehydrogenase
VEVNGLKLPNPFVIGSGPPGTNYQVMKKAFDEGWGGVICKTLSLDSSKVGRHAQEVCSKLAPTAPQSATIHIIAVL